MALQVLDVYVRNRKGALTARPRSDIFEFFRRVIFEFFVMRMM